MLSIKRLDASFGVEASGVDLSGGFEAETMRQLVDALHDNRVLVIRDQSLSKDAYLRFGEQWGTPHPHVLDHLRMPGYPALMAVGNTEEQHKKDEVRNGAAFWHTDQSYEAEPASATMLYAIKVPVSGGETLIADMVGAYDALDETLKARIDDLVVAHLYGAGSGRGAEKIASPLIGEQQVAEVPTVYHRLARPHPVTGRKALYGVAGTPCAIVGMADDEAGALLDQLKAHALADRFVCRHKYAVGDIAIWDTSSTLHCATPIDIATDAATSRLLYRISVKGRPKVCH